jgi:2',3'-cyclic-nucleotide 2'-phosphodiesterase (5'-nucleotidase family)
MNPVPGGRSPHLRIPACGWALGCVLLAAGVAACQGCHVTQGSAPPPLAQGEPGSPTVRLYFVSDLAGALEPCGCTKDQLGGFDHAAAWMSSERARVPSSALVLAGPTFFMDATLKADHRDQDLLKAETIAGGLKAEGCAAFAPGQNDWVAGDDELAKLRTTSGGAALSVAGGASRLVVLNQVPIGFIGIDAPREGTVPRLPPAEVVKREAALLEKQGAKVLVVLASVGRGEAKRIADSVPELTAIVVGSDKAAGEANTEAPPGERVGNVVIAQTSNHLQTVGVLDLFVRDGSYAFADGTGLDAAQKRAELTARVDELHIKIANWERDKSISAADLDARRADLVRLEAERVALDERPAPRSGSFFRYALKEIRDSLGKDAALEATVSAYYKAVNDHNRVTLEGRLPPPPVPGQPSYVGIAVCSSCHKPEKAFWDTTRHSHAYETLASQNKQFNLDCVSCHVTGYDEPGGSSVTHAEKLTDVQCENCHGPGSAHSAKPKVEMPRKEPKEDLCVKCHHSPHVEAFDAKAKMADIIGPGHGL